MINSQRCSLSTYSSYVQTCQRLCPSLASSSCYKQVSDPVPFKLDWQELDSSNPSSSSSSISYRKLEGSLNRPQSVSWDRQGWSWKEISGKSVELMKYCTGILQTSINYLEVNESPVMPCVSGMLSLCFLWWNRISPWQPEAGIIRNRGPISLSPRVGLEVVDRLTSRYAVAHASKQPVWGWEPSASSENWDAQM